MGLNQSSSGEQHWELRPNKLTAAFSGNEGIEKAGGQAENNWVACPKYRYKKICGSFSAEGETGPVPLVLPKF